MAPNSPVLLVINRARNSELVDQLLTESGYSILAASTLHDTDALLADVDETAAVILDVDGFPGEIIERMRTPALEGVPVIVLSRSRESLRGRSVPPIADEILEKPVERQVLVETVDRLVGRSRASPPADRTER